MLKIVNGYKEYKGNTVLEDINLTFSAGQIYGLVGVNGSGKTLILKALCGYITLDSGAVYQGDKKIRDKNNYIENAGIIIESVSLLPHLTLDDNMALLQKIDTRITAKKIDEWLDFYDIKKYRHKKYKHLSLGTKQKLALIQAFAHNPNILILDEPMNALDQQSVEKTANYLLEQKNNGVLIIMTSHISSNIKNLCDVVYHIEEGKIVS